MYKIVGKKILNEFVCLLEINAPLVAKKAKAGQFIIFRVDNFGERVPLTISDFDDKKGTVTIIFQVVGKSTAMLAKLEVGENILDFVGPLGSPSRLDGLKKVAVIGGGVGCAIAYPQAKALFNSGCKVDIIAGFRNKSSMILEDEMKVVSQNLFITTDDGSYGERGFVTTKLTSLIEKGNDYDCVIATGPVIMMKFIAQITKEYNIKNVVSLNPIMIDGTGMCGCCRVTVGGVRKFACVDGPDFDAHHVDFDDLIKRNNSYKETEHKRFIAHVNAQCKCL